MSENGSRRKAQFRIGLATMWARAKQVVTTDPTGSDEDDTIVDEATAHALAREAGRLKGGMAKVAQLTAYDPSASLRRNGQGVNAAAAAILGELWDHAPAVSSAAMSTVIQEEFGKSPQQLFASWEPSPLAAASLGQVHAATSQSGDELAVKVQYPSVAAVLTADLQDRDFVRKLAGAQVGQTLHADALAALADAVKRELDYRLEASALDTFGQLWSHDPVLRFPKVVPELSSARVLTMSRARGVTIAELASDGSAEGQRVKNLVAAAIFRFVWGSSLVHGKFNADPNPGNFLIDYRRNGDGSVAVWCLDFGCVTEIDDKTKLADRELWFGLMETDSQRALERFRLGLAAVGLLARVDSMASTVHRDWELALVTPFHRSPFVWDAAYAKLLSESTHRALLHGGLKLPASLLMLWRQRLGAAAVIGMLNGKFDVRSELQGLIGTGRQALR
jgi:predicted unusual protein kinase regulating ubiquinone biosynthesis (AarF/ABC1/UbiB family)